MTFGQNGVLRYGHVSDFLGIKWPIWVRLTSKLTITKLYFLLVFGPIFCSKASHGQYCTHGPKKCLLKFLHVSWSSPPTPSSKYFIPK